VEKPIADSMGAAAQLVQLERETGVPVLVGHHRRHNPIVQRARQWIAQGRLGRVVTATALATFFKPAAYFDVPWRRSPGGGPVLINLIHDIDMLLHLLGDVRSVQARSSNAVRQFEVEDCAAAVIEFASGALATVCVSDTAAAPWNWDLCAGEQDAYPQQPVQSHFFMGTEGSLSLPDLSLWHYRGERHWHRELSREQTPVHRHDVYARQLEHFIDVIAGRSASLCSAAEGARTLQATLDLLHSAQAAPNA
jgi:predicted dehydrogenase